MNEPARRLGFLIASVAASACVIATPSIAQDGYLDPAVLRVPFDEPRYAAIVEDATSGDVLYEKRSDSVRYPASITKIMTLYLAFEALSTGRLKESDIIVVSPLAASQGPTKLGLRPGDEITVENAMYAIAVLSANDMAVAVAEKIGGSEDRFATMMTLKAHELGMTHTRYVNANGLPDNRQVTTARDIATLCRAVLRDYPQYYHYFGTEEFSYRGRTWNNHNGLLGRMAGVDGFKTGFTNAAGYNLAASAVRDGHRLITVVLGGSSSASRNANVEDLLLAGFDVEEHHDHGEQVMFAQNLFEEPPERGVVPQTAEGDSDAIQLVLNAAEHGAPVTFKPANVEELAAARPGLVSQVQSAGLIAAEAPAPSAQAREPRDWSVQVGEFESGRKATHQIDLVADRFRALFDDREGRVDHIGRRYRATFNGFTESEARYACAALRGAALPCESQLK
jgi:D-alanyl-D-alanine carboxypeptidase